MIPQSLLSGMIGALFGVVAFTVTKDFVNAQSTTAWSGAERAIIATAVPIGIAIGAFVVTFGAVGRLGRG